MPIAMVFCANPRRKLASYKWSSRLLPNIVALPKYLSSRGDMIQNRDSEA